MNFGEGGFSFLLLRSRRVVQWRSACRHEERERDVHHGPVSASPILYRLFQFRRKLLYGLPFHVFFASLRDPIPRLVIG